MTNDSTWLHSCSRAHPCNRPRVCAWCARRRQARIADVAEHIATGQQYMLLTVITPDDAANVGRSRTDYLRDMGAPAGLWTVEQGEQFGRLHVNVLSLLPDETPPPPPGITVHHELVRLTTPEDVRPVAAYIAKQSAMPEPEQYGGRLYGQWGLQHVSSLLVDRQIVRTAPVVAAEALEQLLDRKHRRYAANLVQGPDLITPVLSEDQMAEGIEKGRAYLDRFPTLRRLAAKRDE